jgi:hypothetical protein
MIRLRVLLFAFLVATTAFAAPTAEEHEKARAWLAEGRQRRAAGDHAGALDRFRNAHAVENLPTTGLEVGRTLIDLGRLTDARDVLSAVARATPQPDEPPPLPIARAEAARLAQSLEARIPTLKLEIRGKIDPALRIEVDGVPVTPDLAVLARRLDPGKHTIVARVGESTKSVDVVLAEGQEHVVAIDAPQPAAPAAQPPPKFMPPPPPPSPSRSHTLAWIGGALAITGAVTGSITGAIAITKTNDLRSVCEGGSCAPPQHADLREANGLATVATISFVVAGVGTVLVLVDLLSGSDKKTAMSSSFGSF